MCSKFCVRRHESLLTWNWSPKSICRIDWLERAQWKPIASCSVPEIFKPLRFAKQKVVALEVVPLVAKLRTYSRTSHFLPPIVIVFPQTPILILVGFGIAQNFAHSVNVRERSGTHLFISKWKVPFPLLVLSHLCVELEPMSTEFDPNPDWRQLYKTAIKNVFFHRSQTLNHVQWNTCGNLIMYIPPLLRRDDFKTNLSTKKLKSFTKDYVILQAALFLKFNALKHLEQSKTPT